MDSNNPAKQTKPQKTARISYPTKVLLTVTAVALLVNYVETMVIPGIPTIQKDFSTTATIASWITSAFLIVGAAVSPLFGKLGDIYGKKKIFLTVLLFYIAGVGLAGFSTNIYMLIASRAIQGIGFAIVPLGLAIITDIFPKEKSSHGTGHNQRNLRHRRRGRLNHRRLHRAGPKLAMGFPHRLHPKHHSVLHCRVMLKKDVPGEKSKVDITGATMLDVWHSSHTAVSD